MMKYRVYGSRTLHFETEISASSYKDLVSKLQDKDTLDFYTIIKDSLDDKNFESTSLDMVIRVKDGRTWKDGCLTHTSEGVKSSGQKRSEHLMYFKPLQGWNIK